jgi:hypothetical protein
VLGRADEPCMSSPFRSRRVAAITPVAAVAKLPACRDTSWPGMESNDGRGTNAPASRRQDTGVLFVVSRFPYR